MSDHMKILAVGDLHYKEIYPYAEKFDDRRLDERRQIEDEIVKASKGCDVVVLMGDILDSRQNSYRTIQAVTSFVERFGDKRVVIMSGNHDSSADGTTPLDYLAEIKNKNWLVVTNKIVEENGLVFIPYFRRSQWGVETDEEVVDKVLGEIGINKFAIFIHHAIGKTQTESGQMTDLFKEPVFSQAKLLKKTRFVFGSHIHMPSDQNPVYVLGSVMNMDVGEVADKRVLIIDTEKNSIRNHPLPGRKFGKLVNPTKEELEAIKDFRGLVRIITDKKIEVPAGMAEAVSIMEMPKESRKKVQQVNDFSMPNLLHLYAESKKLDYKKLMDGYNLVQKI